MACIYKATIENTDEGFPKSYIGQTTQPFEKRKYQHHRDAIELNRKSAFFYAIRKYGWENFKWEIIEERDFSAEELDKKEIYYIDKFHTWIGWKDSKRYNVLKGGSNAISLYERLKGMEPVLDKIILMYNQGFSKKKIGEEVGLSQDTIQSILMGRSWSYYTRIQYVPPQVNYLSEEELDYILEKSQNGIHYKEIAKNLKRNPVTIWDVLNGKSYSDYTGIVYSRSKQSNYRKISSEEVKEIVKDFQSRMTCKEIGEKRNIDVKVVWGITSGKTRSKDSGLTYQKGKKTKLTNKEIDVILDLDKQGKTSMEISQITGKGYATIRHLLTRDYFSEYTGIKSKKE